MAYAKATTVSVEKSRMEIEQVVNRYGAAEFGYVNRYEKAMIQFEAKGRVVRFILPLPPLDEFKRKKARGGWKATTENERIALRDQACRSRWRALKIAILAKLESVEAGIEQFEEAFFPQIVDPVSNKTLYEVLQPDLNARYLDNTKTLALPAPDDPDVVDEQ